MGRKSSIQVGDTHNKLTVIDVLPSNKSGTHSKIVVRCVCGVEKTMITPIYLKSKSCGCSRYIDVKPREKKELTDNAAFNALYTQQYQKRAEKDGYAFELDKIEFRRLTSDICYYCGIKPHRVAKNGRSQYTYNGIDRIDNTKGYIKGNVRTACFTCNQAKHKMTTDEFEEWVDRLATHKMEYGHWWETSKTKALFEKGKQQALQELIVEGKIQWPES